MFKLPCAGLVIATFAFAAAMSSACVTRSDYAIPVLPPKSTDYRLEHQYDVDSRIFRDVIGNLLGPRLLDGNSVELLRNGNEIFPAMLDGIRSAKRSITFETFVYWQGDIAEQFAQALSERARAGVPVHVILDWVGAEAILAGSVRTMRDAGVDVRFYNELPWYNPVRWVTDIGEADARTHRKLLVIDGAIGFIGGVGIADEWNGDARSPEEWRDDHFRVLGPVVAQMQSAFIDNWLESGGMLLHDERYFPALTAVGTVKAQVFKSSPYEATELIELMYRLAINAAEHNIRIGTAYFVPNAGTSAALVSAAERGVKIEIIVPSEKIDSRIVRTASRGTWGPLLRAGVKIHEYQPTMYHNKVMVVDDLFVSIGSANFDNRSFHLNDEANLNVFDRKIAGAIVAEFDADLAVSQQITLEVWKNRPLWGKILERAALLIRSEL